MTLTGGDTSIPYAGAPGWVDLPGLSTSFNAPIAGRIVISYNAIFQNGDTGTCTVIVRAVVNDTVGLVQTVGAIPASGTSSVSQTIDAGITTVANQTVPIKLQAYNGNSFCPNLSMAATNWGGGLWATTMTLMLLAI